jgi:Tfp pilus assembly protein PilF
MVDDDHFLESVSHSVVLLEVLDADGKAVGQGTAFFVAEGRVATCWHVVDGAHGARIRFVSGREFPVSGMLWRDEGADFAVLTVATPGVVPVPLPLQTEPPRVGDRIVVVGPPLPGDTQCFASYGRVLPGDKEIQESVDELTLRVPGAPGWSGSPVLSLEGRVVGLVKGGQPATYAHAVPIRILQEALKVAVATVPRPLLESNARSPYGRSKKDQGPAARMPVRLRLAAEAWTRGDVGETTRLIQVAIDADPADAAAWNFLGELRQGAGRTAEAIQAFRRVCEIQPGRADVHATLGYALMKAGFVGEAVEAYREAVRLEEDDPDSRYAFAFCLAATGKYAEAIAQCRKVLEVDSTYAAAQEGIVYWEEMLRRVR